MRWLVLVLLLAAAPFAARADDIGRAIAEAQRAYAAGDLAATRDALAEATQLLAQRAAEGLAGALPAALPGWTAEPPEQQAAGAMLFGGGAHASRRYTHPSGRDVKIEIMADNPMLAQVAMMLANPAMAGAMGRIVRIGPQRAVQRPDGDVMMVVSNRFLVQVSGSGTPEEKLAHARAIDLAKLPG
jgi:hypothetical protein